MPIYRYTANGIDAVEPATFSQLGIAERADLQRLLRDRIDIIAPDTLVIAEEFGEWDGSRRRIDLLAIDKAANIVVIELKRTEDGGHMDLQAVRYAAMVSTMTFDQSVTAFSRYLRNRQDDRNARAAILEFLEWDEPQDDFGSGVRIVLASAEFAPELTTAVLWLNDQGLDITCVRLTPHGEPENVFLEVQQVVPLPEAEDYIIRVREKQHQEREVRRSSRNITKFDLTINGILTPRMAKNRAIHAVLRHLLTGGFTEAQIREAIPWRNKLLLSVNGTVDSEEFGRLIVKQENRFDRVRWFWNDDALIHAHGRTFATSNRWGHRTERALKELMDALQPADWSFERST